jgi:hypothetical protein
MGAEMRATRRPARPGVVTSARASLDASLLLASSTRLRPTKPGT